MTGRTAARSAAVRRRVLAGTVGISLLIAAGGIASTQPTEARFTDPEYGAASFAAISTTPLTNATCTLLPGLTFSGVELKWNSVYNMASITDPTYSPVSGTNSTGATVYLARSNIAQTGPVGGVYTYTATLNLGLLGGLLGTLLGATSTLTIQERYPVAGSQWLTPPKQFRLTVALGGVLGIGTSCTAI